MVERRSYHELLTASKEVKDILTATNVILKRFDLTIFPVRFVQGGVLDSASRERTLQSNKVARDFEEKGLPLEMLVEQGAGPVEATDTPTGKEILLSNSYFGSVFDAEDPSTLSVNLMALFHAVADQSLMYTAQEVELSKDPEMIRYFLNELTSVLKQLPVPDGDQKKLDEYVNDLENIVSTDPSVHIIGKGGRLTLEGEAGRYSTESVNLDISARKIIVRRFLTEAFLKEMKKHKWFLQPENWHPNIKIQYEVKVGEVPRIKGDPKSFLAQYLSGSMARDSYSYLERNVKTPPQSESVNEVDAENLEPVVADTLHQPERDSLQDQRPVEEVSSKKAKSPKKKKERKPKIYPNQKRKIEQALEKERHETNMIHDALRTLHAVLRDEGIEVNSTGENKANIVISTSNKTSTK